MVRLYYCFVHTNGRITCLNDALFTFSEETVENIIAEVCIPRYDSIDVNIDITVPIYVTVSDQTATDAVKACTILWVRTLYK